MMTTAIAILSLLAAPQSAGGKLTIGIGTVESKGADAEAFSALAQGGSIGANTWIKTGPDARAMVDFSDGTQLRVNASTEVLVSDSRKMNVRSGEIFVRGPQGNKTPFQIQADRTRFRSAGQEFNIGHDKAKGISTLIMIKGKSVVATRRDSQNLMGGYYCQTVRGTLNTPDQAGDTVVVTAWTHPLLVGLGEKGAAELETRLQKMILLLGMFARNDPYEKGFRQSGAPGVAFLLKFLKLDPAAQNFKRRVAAARVVGDLAPIKLAPELVRLLQDVEPDVRAYAAKGLARLAGDNLGHDDAYWQGDNRSAGEAKWAEWLKANADKLR